MDLPLGPTLAIVFLVHFQKNWLQNCPSDFKSHYYRSICFIYLTEHFKAF